ncbi:MAG: deoxyuridine 5'-triphosphate nucleotidohydrolase, partial [Dehalococcoidia bacterium]
MSGGLLDRQSILERLRARPPLVEGAVDIETQLQPNGIDLTLRAVERHASAGAIDFSNARRRLADREPVPFDGDGSVHLAPGSYL